MSEDVRIGHEEFDGKDLRVGTLIRKLIFGVTVMIIGGAGTICIRNTFGIHEKSHAGIQPSIRYEGLWMNTLEAQSIDGLAVLAVPNPSVPQQSAYLSIGGAGFELRAEDPMRFDAGHFFCFTTGDCLGEFTIQGSAKAAVGGPANRLCVTLIEQQNPRTILMHRPDIYP